MASLVTLAELRTRSRERADQQNSRFVSDTELNGYINKSASELYDLLTTVFEDYYAEASPYVINIVAGTFQYSLPSDFYKLVGLDELVYQSSTAQQSISIKKYNFQERNSYISPTAGRTVWMYYIPMMTPLVDDSDTFDGINGWDEYIVIDAARKMMQKEESDTSELILEKQNFIKRINDSAPNRDASRPERVTDVYNVDPFAYIQIPSKLRYKIRGQNIQFVESFAYGTVNG